MLSIMLKIYASVKDINSIIIYIMYKIFSSIYVCMLALLMNSI